MIFKWLNDFQTIDWMIIDFQLIEWLIELSIEWLNDFQLNEFQMIEWMINGMINWMIEWVNDACRFVVINMECGVNGFDVVLPHQAGAAITVWKNPWILNNYQ